MIKNHCFEVKTLSSGWGIQICNGH